MTSHSYVSNRHFPKKYLVYRSDGWFDFMVNGGGAVSLRFDRDPFPPARASTFVPWNEVGTNEFLGALASPPRKKKLE